MDNIPIGGNQTHSCNKRDCFFCYEMKRLNNSFNDNPGKTWSEREIRFLIANYSKMTAKDIESIINRSESSIWYKASILNLKKNKNTVQLNVYKEAG